MTPRTHVPSMGDARSPEATQLALPGVVESLSHRYVRSGPDLVHEIVVGRRTFTSSIRLESTDPTDDLLGAWWKAYLRGVRPDTNARGPAVRVAELFCASGGLVLGVDQAARELELGVRSIAAVDQDEEALAIYRRHNSTSVTTTKSVSTLVDYRVRGQGEDCTFVYEPELVDPEWSDLVGSIDVLLAGPPCQGHSNLNNRTRRNDERNALYLTVPAIGVALRAPIVVIENVQAVVHDRKQVVQSAIALLERAGYSVTTHVLRAAELGWPQRRQRFFVVARRDRPPLPLAEVSRVFSAEPRDLWWAIGDLEHHDSDHFMDQQPELSEENRRRIDWLFDNDEYDLALDQRPTSHRNGTTYNAVYGRLRPDQPSPTITTGFMTPGRGRYIHPTQRRVLTAREAARLQGFPDTYDFTVRRGAPPSKAKLSKWIGDAVPMPLGYVAAIAALAPGWPPTTHRS